MSEALHQVTPVLVAPLAISKLTFFLYGREEEPVHERCLPRRRVLTCQSPSPSLVSHYRKPWLCVQHITSRAANSRLNTSRKVTYGCESLPLQLHGIRLTTGFCVPSLPNSTQLQLPTQACWSAVSRQRCFIRNPVLSPSSSDSSIHLTSQEATQADYREHLCPPGRLIAGSTKLKNQDSWV